MRLVRAHPMLRLDPAHQLLWRDDDTVQFGIDRRAELALTEPWQEQLLEELRRGIRRSSFDVIAHTIGAPREGARRMLAALEPVLHLEPLRPPAVHVRADEIDDEPGALCLTALLRDAGCSVVRADYRDALSVRLVRGTAVAAQFVGELSADRPHLPVAFDVGGAVIGPLVVPGRTPCLGCRDAVATAHDPAWPRLHAQLIGRAGGRIGAARAAQVAPLVLELLRDEDPGMRAVRLGVDGRRAEHPIAFSEECGCRSLLPGAPRESGTGAARSGPHERPTTPSAFARPA